MGERHLQIFQRMSSMAATAPTWQAHILEWGCGGGSNALAFGRLSSQYMAVDISQESVDECLRQMKLHGLSHGIGVLADIHEPEQAIKSIAPVDVVVCTYVFELLPTRQYSLRLLRLFHEALKPGGVALVQIRYATLKSSTRGRRWGYRMGFTQMVAFFIDEFWQEASRIGFRPVCIELLPFDETVSDERYAYFLLERPVAKGSPGKR